MTNEEERLIIKRDGYPSPGEIVIGTVTRVMDFGAFVSLDEYENKEGMVHISEVAPGWIKDIRDHVKKGQKVICKVLSVNPKRGHIDLSIKDVTERQRKEKLQEWKNELKAFKWLEIIGEKLGMSKDQLVEIGKKLIKEYDSVHEAFVEVAYEGYEVLAKLVGEEFAKEMAEIARDNIKPPRVKVRGYFELKSFAGDGVERVKKVLLTIRDVIEKSSPDIMVKLYTVGAPRYRLELEAYDYKTLEKALAEALEEGEKTARSLGVEFSFTREKQ